MKKLICAFLLVPVMLLCACAEPVFEKERLFVTHTSFEIPSAKQQNVTLYYPNSDNTDVIAFTQKLQGGEGLYHKIMEALLNGTEDGYVSPFDKGVTLRSMLLIQNILYIDLSWQFEKMPVEKFYACLSVLANTFTGLNEVDFINITVEGRQLTAPMLSEYPIMLLSKYSGTIEQLIAHYKAVTDAKKEGTAVIEAFYGVVYTADESGKYLIPQTVSITQNDNNYASVLTSALFSKSRSIFPDGFMLSEMPHYDGNSGQLKISLTCPKDWKHTEGWLGTYALVCTLECLFPDIKNCALTISDVSGKEIYSVNEASSDYYSYIRSSVEVVMPNSSGTNLAKINLLVENMPATDNYRAFVNEYICFVNPQFREYDSIVNDVIVNGDTVYVDLGSRYFEYYDAQQLSAQQEYAIIYSLLTTVCTYTGASRALFLEDNQLRSTFLGNIKLDSPLLSLPKEYIESIK